MPLPKILLLSRTTLRERLPELQEYLNIVPVEVCLVPSPEDAIEGNKIATSAGFQKPVAIIADFARDIVVNDDGSAEWLELRKTEVTEPSLVVPAE